VRPMMFTDTESSSSIFRTAFAVLIRFTTRHSQPVPSRHGVHWPQDSS
jgi:hypothetical protein